MTPPLPGEVAVAGLDPDVRNKQGGVRPVLVISGRLYNQLRIHHVIVVPVTRTQRGLPFHVPVGPEAGLRETSYAMADSVRAISTRRLGKTLGHAAAGTTRTVREHVIAFLTGQR
ncbi:MAG TPA: type II toxin-antitoxin system PemK/MazF family toxin [Streptosporangiaceae bacterium]|nr:type II toxin-antitoxin system PemK/MazF family toxin [Streptosporangiaceae bacterium]